MTVPLTLGALTLRLKPSFACEVNKYVKEYSLCLWGNKSKEFFHLFGCYLSTYESRFLLSGDDLAI